MKFGNEELTCTISSEKDFLKLGGAVLNLILMLEEFSPAEAKLIMERFGIEYSRSNSED